MNQEQKRIEARRTGDEPWALWGPYLSERAWGTVREDYSTDGEAWEYFGHEQAPLRAYRWSEDGLAGVCDNEQRLCLAFALWNGRDPILKERMFGLTSRQGNHGEDVKEYFFYLDATPTHSFLKYLYKYPQGEFPYKRLVDENQNRTREDPPFSLLDTGIFNENRYWDVHVTWARETPERMFIRVSLTNRGPDRASLHVLPTLWFRNTWSWGGESTEKPRIKAVQAEQAAWAAEAEHETLGRYILAGRQQAKPLFTENETNHQALFGTSNESPYTKDAFHRRVTDGEDGAVNPDQTGTKFAAWHTVECGGGESAVIDLVLSPELAEHPFADMDEIIGRRQAEADEFYGGLLPGASGEDAGIYRQAMAGMIWCRQFYHYDVARWLDGDQVEPPENHRRVRNRKWRHLTACDIISIPDKWEYPWFASWDLAYHCMVFAYLDVDFAKEQIELLLNWRYLHPNGHIPAYEWEFGDANPPIHAVAALKVYRAERKLRGRGDHHYLRRVFNKLLLSYGWWLNRKDADDLNVFEGGFMGLDNISVYNRSDPLPAGYRLKEADATGWMAMFALNMTNMALELAQEQPEYEDMAIQCYRQFLSIANSIAGHSSGKLSLWDPEAGFFKDLVISPDGDCNRIDVYSYVGLVPLFACELVAPDIIENVPRFKKMLHEHQGGVFDGHTICSCPLAANENGERLLSLVDHTMIPPILERLLDENEFMSGHGIRSVSRIHAERQDLGTLPGIGTALIAYEPGEASSVILGGNSNWRGPVWLPINYSILQALTRFDRYLGPGFKLTAPSFGPGEMNLKDIANAIAERLIGIFRRDDNGLRPVYPENSPFQNDPHWKDLHQFHEYFHGDTGQGLGASHQTGWTGLVANLIKRHYELKARSGENGRD